MKKFNVAKSPINLYNRLVCAGSIYGTYDATRVRSVVYDKNGREHARYTDEICVPFCYVLTDFTPYITRTTCGNFVRYAVSIYDNERGFWFTPKPETMKWQALYDFIDATLSLPKNNGLRRKSVVKPDTFHKMKYYVCDKQFCTLHSAKNYANSIHASVYTEDNYAVAMPEYRNVGRYIMGGGYGYFGKTPDNTTTETDAIYAWGGRKRC